MIINLFGHDININLVNIIQYIIDNKVLLIPGILYLFFNNFISIYNVIIIFCVILLFNQFSVNDKIMNELTNLKKKINN